MNDGHFQLINKISVLKRNTSVLPERSDFKLKMTNLSVRFPAVNPKLIKITIQSDPWFSTLMLPLVNYAKYETISFHVFFPLVLNSEFLEFRFIDKENNDSNWYDKCQNGIMLYRKYIMLYSSYSINMYYIYSYC